jgi:hypothetical protein
MVTPNDEELQAALEADVEGLAVALLGEPTKQSRIISGDPGAHVICSTGLF